ncbi:hypothetical protein ARSEF4850_007377 [Beauveria asiatica]
MASAVTHLEYGLNSDLESMLSRKAPGASRSRINKLTTLCVANVESLSPYSNRNLMNAENESSDDDIPLAILRGVRKQTATPQSTRPEENRSLTSINNTRPHNVVPSIILQGSHHAKKRKASDDINSDRFVWREPMNHRKHFNSQALDATQNLLALKTGQSVPRQTHSSIETQRNKSAAANYGLANRCNGNAGTGSVEHTTRQISKSTGYNKPMDFGNVPKDQLPPKVLSNPAWL